MSFSNILLSTDIDCGDIVCFNNHLEHDEHLVGQLNKILLFNFAGLYVCKLQVTWGTNFKTVWWGRKIFQLEEHIEKELQDLRAVRHKLKTFRYDNSHFIHARTQEMFHKICYTGLINLLLKKHKNFALKT